MKIRPVFKLCDAWVGAYWDSESRRLYLLPIPFVGIMLDFDPDRQVREAADEAVMQATHAEAVEELAQTREMLGYEKDRAFRLESDNFAFREIVRRQTTIRENENVSDAAWRLLQELRTEAHDLRETRDRAVEDIGIYKACRTGARLAMGRALELLNGKPSGRIGSDAAGIRQVEIDPAKKFTLFPADEVEAVKASLVDAMNDAVVRISKKVDVRQLTVPCAEPASVDPEYVVELEALARRALDELHKHKLRTQSDRPDRDSGACDFCGRTIGARA